MKLIITLLLIILILLSGCSSTPADPVDALSKEYIVLKADYNALMQEKEKLEGVSANLTDLRNKHNKLINDYHTLQIQYAVTGAYSESQREQYNALVEQFSSRYVDSGDIITELYKQNFNLIERQSELNEQIEAVHKGNVPILSDNLTETEYTAFHKGWNLWWETFND